MKLSFPILLSIGVAATVGAVILLTPDPTLNLTGAPATPASEPSFRSSAGVIDRVPGDPVVDPTVGPGVAVTPEHSISPVLTSPAPLPPASGLVRPPAAQPLTPPSSATLARPQAPIVPPLQSTSAKVQPSIPLDESSEGIRVPRGTVLPASLLDTAHEATPAQIQVMDRIADEFVNEISSNTQEPVPPDSEARPAGARHDGDRSADWSTATREANERYRLIFGDERYKAWAAEAARDALLEKQAANAQ